MRLLFDTGKKVSLEIDPFHFQLKANPKDLGKYRKTVFFFKFLSSKLRK
jgi:hypothetical protein